MPPAPAGVVVVGDLMADVVAHLRRDLEPGTDTPASVTLAPGGSAANTAAWLAAAGVATAIIGAVGDDLLGRAQTDDLAARGVEVVVGRHPVATGAIVVLVDAAGERSFATDRGANALLAFGAAEVGVLARHRHLHLSGYALFDGRSRPAARRALGAARDASMTVSVDVGSAAPLRAAGAERWREWTTGVDICFANRSEGALLTDRHEPDTIVSRLAELYPTAVLKLGADGCLWASGAGRARVAAGPGPVVDTVGAGDALAAGFLAAWLGGAAPPDALGAGSVLASRAVAVVGGRPPR
jgi:ribokinase